MGWLQGDSGDGMKWLLVAMLSVACHSTNYKVKVVLACSAKDCRVEVADGKRFTVSGPVAVGDTIMCGAISAGYCKVLP